MTVVTRTLQADTPKELYPICKAMGYVRADIWRRYGGLGTVGRSPHDVRKEVAERRLYFDLSVDGTIRNQTTKDIVNDLFLYRASAMKQVRRAVAARTDDEDERKRLYSLLLSGHWTTDNFLHRQVRKHFKHGHSQVENQFVVRSDKYGTEIVNGHFVVIIHIATKYGAPIRLTTSSNGTNVDFTGKNLRIVVKDDCTEIHYAFDKGEGRPHGEKTVGIDKGFTEAFVDSDGEVHGANFGKIMTEYSDQVSATGRSRNKLYALEKKHREAGHPGKADNIKMNNLGKKKINARKTRAQKKLRTSAFQSAHAIVNKASTVVSEDLTHLQLPRKNNGRGTTDV